MFVRRLMQWLTGLLASARRVSRGAPATEIADAGAVSLPITNWLADARRVRPARGVAMAPVAGLRERAMPPRLRSGAIGREQVAAGRSRPLETPPGAQPPSRGDQAAQQQPTPAAPQSQPLAPRPDFPALEPAPTLGDDAVLHRQLTAFKQLVRLGVYNEGFRRDALPEQYARSLGMDDRLDDDFSAGDEQN